MSRITFYEEVEVDVYLSDVVDQLTKDQKEEMLSLLKKDFSENLNFDNLPGNILDMAKSLRKFYYKDLEFEYLIEKLIELK